MVSLQLPILPGRLHRYRSLTRDAAALDQEVDSIVNNYIWCSNFLKMNDPMEGFFRSSKLLKSRPDYKARVKEIVGEKSNTGIACFSERADSVLMWAHYADDYEGICISYSGVALNKGLPQSVKLLRLAYADESPLLYPSHAENAEDATTRILSQKRQDWAYERECASLPTKVGFRLATPNRSSGYISAFV
jgi:hypothetical protein